MYCKHLSLCHSLFLQYSITLFLSIFLSFTCSVFSTHTNEYGRTEKFFQSKWKYWHIICSCVSSKCTEASTHPLTHSHTHKGRHICLIYVCVHSLNCQVSHLGEIAWNIYNSETYFFLAVTFSPQSNNPNSEAPGKKISCFFCCCNSIINPNVVMWEDMINTRNCAHWLLLQGVKFVFFS